MYVQITLKPNISHTLVGNKIADHSDVVGASPVGAAPTTYLHSQLDTWLQWIGQRQSTENETRNIQVLGFGVLYWRFDSVHFFHNVGINICQ